MVPYPRLNQQGAQVDCVELSLPLRSGASSSPRVSRSRLTSRPARLMTAAGGLAQQRDCRGSWGPPCLIHRAGSRQSSRAEERMCPRRTSCTRLPPRRRQTCPWRMPYTILRPPGSRIRVRRSGRRWSHCWSICWGSRICRQSSDGRPDFPLSRSKCPTGTEGTCQRRAGSTYLLDRGCRRWLLFGRMTRPDTGSTCWPRQESTCPLDNRHTVSSQLWRISQLGNDGT